MKKIVLVIAILVSMVFVADAQSDGFWGGSGGGGSRSEMPDPNGSMIVPSDKVGMVNGPVDATNAPLGSGLLILTMLGAGYLVTKEKKDK